MFAVVELAVFLSSQLRLLLFWALSKPAPALRNLIYFFSFCRCKYANSILPVLKAENEVATDKMICRVSSDSRGTWSFKHNKRPESWGEQQRGGERRSRQGFLLWVFIKGDFKFGVLFRSVVFSVQTSTKWFLVFYQENTLLSLSKWFSTINIIFSGGNNNNTLWMSGVKVIFSAYLHFVFSHPEVNSFTLY